MSTSHESGSVSPPDALFPPVVPVDERTEKRLREKAFGYITAAVFALLVAVLEWWRHLHGSDAHPFTFTLVAVTALPFCLWKVIQLRDQAEMAAVARQGERAVAELLDRLRALGFRIFRDLPAQDDRVEVAAVGPLGVYVIRTMTWRRPAEGNPVVEYDGERLLVYRVEPERGCLARARREARWLARAAEEIAGRRVPVQAAIVIPGWRVDGPPEGFGRDVWVADPASLLTRIERTPDAMTAQEAERIAGRLAQRTGASSPT